MQEPNTAAKSTVPADALPGAGPRGLADPTPFLGREREMAQLQAGLDRAVRGRGELLLIAGEAGIGKTRLVSQLADVALGGDAESRPGRRRPTMVWGRCWDSGGAPSMWPWINLLRELVLARDPGELRDELGSAAPWLAQLVPELRGLLPGLEAAPALDSEQSRFVLFDALASFLRRASVRQPLVIVLDDIHAADQLSLLALLFIARQLPEMAILMIATHREGEPGQSPELAGLLTKLARAGRCVSLSGLPPEQISRLIDHRRGGACDRELARALHSATGGNPFFSDETVRMLLGQGRLDALGAERVAPLPVPIGVRGVIEQRLLALPDLAQHALRSAAVIGRRFALGTLAQVSGQTRGDLREALEWAITARLVELSEDEVASFGFVHELIRETVYAGLPPLERARRHLAVGEALERRYAGAPDRHVDELAYHFLEALPAGDPAVALRYAQRAADHAMARFAYERAAWLYAAALQALDLTDGLAPGEQALQQATLLLGLGRARLRIADPSGRETLLEAAAAARAAQSPEALARVALAFGAFALSPGLVDVELTGLLEDALEGISPEGGRLRVHLLGRLARALYWSPETERRRQLIDQALEMARRLGDAETLSIALGNCIPASRGPDTAEIALGWIDELLSLPQAPAELVVLARSIEIDLLLERGAVAAADAAIDSLEHHAERLRDLRALSYVPIQRARRAMMEGRYTDAERLIEQAHEISADIEDSTFPLTIAGARFALSLARGRPGEVEDGVRHLAQALPNMHVWRACLALIDVSRGEHHEAQRLVDRLAAGELAGIPRNNMWLITLALLAEACAALGDVTHARQLYAALLPSGRLTVISPVSGYIGPVARYLGLLAEALGDLTAAEGHLRAALDLARRHRTRPMSALIAVELACTLATAGDAAATLEAHELLDSAERLAGELGLPVVLERATSVRSALPSAGPRAPSARPAQEAVVATLSREGEVWSLRFQGRLVRVRDSKGVRYLAQLLSQPGVEVHALDLVRGADPGEASAPTVSGASAKADQLSSEGTQAGIGSALDAAAKAAYRRRLEDLREEADEAERWGDPERGYRAREEIDFIARELAAAVGLGGRDRPQSSAAERARVNVTRAIRGAIRRVAEQNADLGAELEATVHTGLFCRHGPDLRRPVRWEVHER